MEHASDTVSSYSDTFMITLHSLRNNNNHKYKYIATTVDTAMDRPISNRNMDHGECKIYCKLTQKPSWERNVPL